MALIPALGTKLAYDSGGGSYVNIAQVKEISGYDLQYGSVETTNLDSTAATVRGTLLKAGQLGLKLQFDPDNTGHTWLESKMTGGISQATSNFRLILTDSTPSNYTFAALVVGFTINGMDPESECIMADVVLQMSGTPTKA